MLDFLCKESYDLRDFVALITFLRSPDGCPWDQVQTHESIRRNFLEETYEVCEAIDAGDTAHLKEELGDVLMQVLFHTDIEREAGHFDIDDVADAACKSSSTGIRMCSGATSRMRRTGTRSSSASARRRPPPRRWTAWRAVCRHFGAVKDSGQGGQDRL